MKVNVIFNLEEGYRVEVLDRQGFVDTTMDITAEELPPLMRELCEECLDKEQSVDALLAMLRKAFELFNLKSMTFNTDSGYIQLGG